MKGRLCVVKKFIAMVLCLAMLLGLAACAKTTQEQQSTTEETEDETTTQSTEMVYDEDPPVAEEIKVLAIGNSFSVDALTHLYGLFEDAGVENYTIGNLYIGGCSIDRHWTYMKQNDAYYTFTCVRDGQTTRKDKVTANYGLTFDDWDIITLQQLSHESADEAYFENLQNVIDYVKKKAPQAQIWWHMGWSYPEGAQDLKNLNMTQLELYEGIVEVIDSTILTNPDITGVIPVGTTIQNLRTSKLGDTLNRDETHLTEGIGRYAAAMTWLAALTGADVDKIKWTPEKFPETNYALPFIKDAVKKAIHTPYAVTQSAYPPANKG